MIDFDLHLIGRPFKCLDKFENIIVSLESISSRRFHFDSQVFVDASSQLCSSHFLWSPAIVQYPDDVIAVVALVTTSITSGFFHGGKRSLPPDCRSSGTGDSVKRLNSGSSDITSPKAISSSQNSLRRTLSTSSNGSCSSGSSSLTDREKLELKNIEFALSPEMTAATQKHIGLVQRRP